MVQGHTGMEVAPGAEAQRARRELVEEKLRNECRIFILGPESKRLKC